MVAVAGVVSERPVKDVGEPFSAEPSQAEREGSRAEARAPRSASAGGRGRRLWPDETLKPGKSEFLIERALKLLQQTTDGDARWN